jgi:hypothetical protein
MVQGEWVDATAAEADNLRFQGHSGGASQILEQVVSIFGGPLGVLPWNTSKLLDQDGKCATHSMRVVAKLWEVNRSVVNHDAASVDEFIAAWNAIPGVDQSHLMPWYDASLWRLMQLHGPRIGFNGLLTAMPRMRSCFRYGSGGDAQGMMMHWLGTWVVRGALRATAKDALMLLTSTGSDKAFLAGRGLVHGILWADLEIWTAEQGLDARNLADADKRRLWDRATDACMPRGFRCRFFFVSCMHGVGHAAQRLTHNPKAYGYRRLSSTALDSRSYQELSKKFSETASESGVATGQREYDKHYPGVSLCEGAPSRDMAYMCATGFYHDTSTLVETVNVHKLMGLVRQLPANVSTKTTRAWTHQLCIGAPFELSCFVRLFEGVFTPLPSMEKPNCLDLELPPHSMRACLWARFMFESLTPSFFGQALRGPFDTTQQRAHVKCVSIRGSRSCIAHPILHQCLPMHTVDQRIACIWGAAFGMSRSLRYSYVNPSLATLFCDVFTPLDARYTKACFDALLGWTGVIDDPRYPSRYGAEFLDSPIQF